MIQNRSMPQSTVIPEISTANAWLPSAPARNVPGSGVSEIPAGVVEPSGFKSHWNAGASTTVFSGSPQKS